MSKGKELGFDNQVNRIILASEYLSIVGKLKEEDRIKLKDVISVFTKGIIKKERRQAKAGVFEDLDNLLDNFIRNVVGFKEKYNKLKEKHLGGE